MYKCFLKNAIFTYMFSRFSSFFFFCQDMNRSLNQAIEVLNSRPQTVAEIAEANQKHIEFEKSNKEVFLN